MKKIKIVFSLFLFVLVMGFASAFWPFDGNVMTGNVVDGDIIDDSDLNRCSDSDGGCISNVSGTLNWLGVFYGSTNYNDTCLSGSILREHYCVDSGKYKGAKSYKSITCENGCYKGACRTEKVCTVLDEGAVDTFDKFNKNVCVGVRVRKYDSFGKAFLAYPGIKEYSCDDEGNVFSNETFSDSQNEGYCRLVTKKINGQTVTNVGEWFPPNPVCIDLGNGRFKDQDGKIFTTKCVGAKGPYIKYSCNENYTEVLNSTSSCPNTCNVGKGGCYGSCAGETDEDNNKDVPGNLTVDGFPQPDKCTANKKAVVQYTCVNNAMRVIGALACGANRICDDGDGHGAYCKDLYASADIAGTVSALSGQVSGDVSGLNNRVSALETVVLGTQSLGNCAPLSEINSDETGYISCQKENKVCLIGLNYARMINSTSGEVVPLHLDVRACSETMEMLSGEDLPSDISFDVDPNWICCSGQSDSTLPSVSDSSGESSSGGSGSSE